MTETAWYRTGTVTVTAGSKSVAGVGSAWLSQALPGDLFALADANGNLSTTPAEVGAVTSDTALALKAIWPGSTVSGSAYAIIRNFTGTLSADLSARLAKLISQYQITINEMTTLLSTDGTVTLTKLTGETVSVAGLLSYANQVPTHNANDAAHGMTATGRALLRATDAAAGRTALGALAKDNPASIGAMTHSGPASFTGGVSSNNWVAGKTTGMSTPAAGNYWLCIGMFQYQHNVKVCVKIESQDAEESLTIESMTTYYAAQAAFTVRRQSYRSMVKYVGISAGGDAQNKYLWVNVVQPGFIANLSVVIEGVGFVSFPNTVVTDGSQPTQRVLVDMSAKLGASDAAMYVNGDANFSGGVRSNGIMLCESLGDSQFRFLTGNYGFGPEIRTRIDGGSSNRWLTIGMRDNTGAYSPSLKVSEFGVSVLSGNFLVGMTSGNSHGIAKTVSTDVAGLVLEIGHPNSMQCGFYGVTGVGFSSTYTAFVIGKSATTGRSINAGGTINASGADYAEYEIATAAFVNEIAKGAIVGFDADGELTLNFDDALSFGVKSTDPCMVGGDVWGTEEALGMKRPTQPQFIAPEYVGSAKPADLPAKPIQQALTDYATAMCVWQVLADAYAVALAQYEADLAAYTATVAAAQAEFDAVTMPAYQESLAAFEAALEAARLTVDRVAYSGKVPVNVLGASVGDYIVAVRAEDGGIAGVAVGDDEISFAQYRKAVGRVRRIEEDGRALIAVIVH